MADIYKHNNINYETNGDITLTPTTLTGKIELNGICEITLEHSYDKESRWKYILEDSVIACPTPWSSKQLFRIYNVVKTITGVTAHARHVYFDLANYILLDVRPTTKTGQEALNTILTNTPFTGHSNISTVNTAYYVRKNVIEALASDDENSFINRWGGERYIDNYNLTINDKIGEDRGVRVEFGYNLAEIEEDVNLDEVVTRIIPVGYNGIMLAGSSPWIDSNNINKYAVIKTKVIAFEDVKVKESTEDEEGFNSLAEAQAELINRCNLLFDGGIDTPTVNYKVNMVNLADTTEYKDYKVLETVDLGDIVHCKHSGLDIDISARSISYEWEVIDEKVRYTNIELGNFVENYFDKQTDITNRVSNILSDLDARVNSGLTPGGAIRAEKIKGFIDGTKASIKAQKSIAQKQDVRAIECEDSDPSSLNFGSSIFGSMGLMVADSKNTSGDWDYTSALTAKGLVANVLYGKILAGTGAYFDIEKGEIYFNKGLIQGSNSSWDLATGEIQSNLPDGSKIVISPANGFYNMFGTSKREYHHLSYSGSAQIPKYTGSGSGTGQVTIQLPDEFKGKKFSVTPSVSVVRCSNFNHAVNDMGCFVTSINYTNGTFILNGFLTEVNCNGSIISNNNNIEVVYTATA